MTPTHGPTRSRELSGQKAAIRIDEVGHAYGERQALTGISLEVKQAEMFWPSRPQWRR